MQEQKLEMYCDENWASDEKTRMLSCVMMIVNKTLILWRVVGQKSVALSTMEAKCVVLSASTKSALYSINEIICSMESISRNCRLFLPKIQTNTVC